MNISSFIFVIRFIPHKFSSNMNENKRALFLIVFIVALGAVLVQTKKTGLSSDITNDEIMDHIRYLSHENRGGRYPGCLLYTSPSPRDRQ